MSVSQSVLQFSVGLSVGLIHLLVSPGVKFLKYILMSHSYSYFEMLIIILKYIIMVMCLYARVIMCIETRSACLLGYLVGLGFFFRRVFQMPLKAFNRRHRLCIRVSVHSFIRLSVYPCIRVSMYPYNSVSIGLREYVSIGCKATD